MIDVRAHHDLEALSLTITAELDATVERAWQLWSDPRQLEQWWGPPGYPSTVVEHELVPGGKVTYFMTGPDGEEYHGYWRVVSVDEPNGLVYEDGFAEADGAPNDAMPVTTTVVTLTAREGGGTTMVVHGTHETVEDLQKLLDMGAVEGMRAAVGQIEAILAGDVTVA